MIYPVKSASPSRTARIKQGEDEAQRPDGLNRETFYEAVKNRYPIVGLLMQIFGANHSDPGPGQRIGGFVKGILFIQIVSFQNVR